METDSTVRVEDTAAKGTSFARHIPTVVRILMGLMFVVFGLNGFLRFIPEPKNQTMPEGAAAFAGALMNTGYMMPLVMGVMLLVGVLLLLNLFVPLALALIAPILVGINTFHIFLAPSSIGPGLVLLIMELYLAWAYRNAFRPMLAARTKPGG